MKNECKSSNNKIGTLGENSLHAALKRSLTKPGDLIETPIDNYIIDIIHQGQLIEIQTGNFSSIKKKLNHLLNNHQVLLVYPIPKAKWIIKQEVDGSIVSRKKSPKTGRVEELFRELIRIPAIAAHPNFKLIVTMVTIEEIWINDGKGSWRRKYWSIADQRLLQIIEQFEFNTIIDYLNILPKHLPARFSNKDLSSALKIQTHLARKITYSLRKMGAIDLVDKDRNANIYQVNSTFT